MGNEEIKYILSVSSVMFGTIVGLIAIALKQLQILMLSIGFILIGLIFGISMYYDFKRLDN